VMFGFQDSSYFLYSALTAEILKTTVEFTFVVEPSPAMKMFIPFCTFLS
jgi:hypothetical protein